ncbi:MAG: VIT domain-containing protein [Blastocatellia bacterium]
MRPKHLFALVAILFVSIDCFGQGVVTPRRHQKNQQASEGNQSEPQPATPLPSALPVSDIKIKARLEGQVATVKVEHFFRNDTDEVLEGTYYFPVPEGATLLEFAVFDGDERRVGRVREKAEARAAYSTAIAQGEDPALLEMTKRGWFQSHVYPIQPHADKRIEIIYSQVLADKDGVITFNYALGRGYKKLKVPVAKVEIEVDLRSEVAIKNFFSPTHPLDIQHDGDRHVTARLTTTGGSDAENFQLVYSLSDEDISMSLMTYRKRGEDGYFLLMLSPKIDFDKKRVSAKDVLFVVDISNSMEGEKIRQAKEAIRFGLTKTLNPDDRFNIIAFAGTVRPMQQGMLQATPANIRRALEYVDNIALAPSTNINDALVTAMTIFEHDERLHNLVFLTDGVPNESVTEPGEIAANVRAANRTRARLFTFGVGQDVNHNLLEKLAAENRGAGLDIVDQSQLSRELSTFFSKVSQPVLSDLRVNFGPVIADRIHPGELPDLYTRSQIKIFGRYRNQEDLDHITVSLAGRMNEQPQQFDFSGLHFPLVTDDKDFLPKLWATERVSALLSEIRISGERAELKQEVIDLAREFNLVTPYTSMYVPTTAEMAKEKADSPDPQTNKEATAQSKSIERFERLPLLADRQRSLDYKNQTTTEAAEAGGVAQAQVSDSVVVIDSVNATIGGSRVTTRGIQELPVNGRNFSQNATLKPGAERAAANAVVDANGAAIPNATVTIKDQNTGLSRTVTTDEEGNYPTTGIPPGNYQVQVQAPGFNTTTVDNVTVQPGQPPATGVTLTAGVTAEVVNITAVASAVDSSTSNMSSSYNSKQTRDLPALAPVDSFARLASGVNSTSFNELITDQAGADKQGEFRFWINGGRPLSNGFTLDGYDNNDIDGHPAISIRNFDAIDMLHVMATRATGDVSETNASSINLITRRGTNDFHGSLFDYHLNRKLGALTPLERRSGLDSAPKFRSDIFGGTFGGPIQRDRMFFFSSFTRETESSRRFVDSTASQLTPTARGLDKLARAFPGSDTVSDLVARGPLAQTTGDPRVTRTFRRSVLGVPIEFGQVTRTIPSKATGYETGGRFDAGLTSRDRLQAGYWYTSRNETDSISRMAAGYTGDTSGSAQLGNVRWTRLLSPRSTNELGFNFSRARASLAGFSAESGPSVNTGFRGLSYGASPFVPSSHHSTLFEATETLSHIARRHNLKLGAQVRGRLTGFDFLPGAAAQYSYQSFDDFVLDKPAALSVAIGDPRSSFSELHHHLFIDDAWRVKSNLTLSLGLSYETAGQPVNQLIDRIRERESDSARSLFDQSLPSLQKIDRDNNNFAPRIGFAYTPRFLVFGKNLFGYDKTVIRGGASLSYDQTAYRPLADMAASAPNVLPGVITPTNAIALPAFPNVPDADDLRLLLGRSPLAYARTQLANDYHTPTTLSWHLDTSRDFNRNLLIGMAYVGTRGAGLIRAIDGNPFSDGSTGALRVYETSGHSIYHSFQIRSDFRLTDRITGGIAYTLSKLIDDVPDNVSTFGGGVGNASMPGSTALQSFAQNPFDASRGERAISSLDRRHALTANFIWDLPLRRDQTRVLGRLLGGWKASAIVEVASGSPFTPVQFIGNTQGSPALYASIFSDRLGAVRPFAGNAGAPVDTVAFSNAANSFFNFFSNPDGTPFISSTGFIIADSRGFRAGSPESARFIYNDYAVESAARARGLASDGLGKTYAAGRRFGNTGRNTLFSPRLVNVNFALIKNTKLSEKVSLQFRSEFFNLFNHPNRTKPNAVLENAGGFGFADFGETDANPRRIRIALKLLF